MKLSSKTKYILIGLFLFSPIFVSAGLVPCGAKVDDPVTAVDETEVCEFSHLVLLINNIINFLLVSILLPLAAIMFAAAGFMIVTAGGDPGRISQGKEIFGSVLKGILIAFMAWLAVQTILVAVGFDSALSFLG